MMSLSYWTSRKHEASVECVRLGDPARCMEAAILPGFGAIACDLQVCGQPLLWRPVESVAEVACNRHFCGIPLMAPWANRLDGVEYAVHGRQYRLNPAIGNYMLDGGGLPIHGLLAFSDKWQVEELAADEAGARVTSCLEFWRYPDLMAQFPFAHTLRITHRLAGGGFEVETAIENHAREAIPVALGFHPYLCLGKSTSADWKLHIPARERLELDARLIPTGRRFHAGLPEWIAIAAEPLDGLFTAVERDGAGFAHFVVREGARSLTLSMGPRYKVAAVYTPGDGASVCIEPMVAPTSALTSGAAEIDWIPPGGTWRERFRLTPSGF